MVTRGRMPDAGAPRLGENVLHFARVLRAAGLPVGTDRVMLALDALTIGGLESRRDFHAVLAACLVDRAEHLDMFDQAFQLFWRDPDLLGRMLAAMLPQVQGPGDALPQHRENRRLADALFAPRERPAPEPERESIEVDASFTFSATELLRKADFETMTAAEWVQARRMIEAVRASLPTVRTRRYERAHAGRRLDWRRVAATSARRGGEPGELAWRRARVAIAPVVALVDISGSMSNYSRMFLHFLHVLMQANTHTHTFLFGTRLTNVTRMLRHRDPDRAVDDCVRAVDDWSGGTRISGCLHEFNLHWNRRVLGGSATVLLVTDGLERDDAQQLAREAERLSKSCRRLLWLNPLLRWEGFEPRAAGVRALLPQVDAHLPVHNVASLDDLAQALRTLAHGDRPERRRAA